MKVQWLSWRKLTEFVTEVLRFFFFWGYQGPQNLICPSNKKTLLTALIFSEQVKSSQDPGDSIKSHFSANKRIQIAEVILTEQVKSSHGPRLNIKPGAICTQQLKLQWPGSMITNPHPWVTNFLQSLVSNPHISANQCHLDLIFKSFINWINCATAQKN